MKKLVYSLLIFFGFTATNVFAFSAITPNAKRITVAPGETKTVKIGFMVLEEKPTNISFSPVNVAVGSNGNILLSDKLENLKPSRHSGVPFVQKIKSITTEGKGAWVYVPVTISVPKDAHSGDYPVGIQASKPLSKLSLLIIDVPGKNVPLNGSIKEAKIEVLEDRVTVTAEYENKSPRTFLPVVGCSLKKDGQNFGAMELEISNVMYDFVLPYNTRTFSASFQRPLPVGAYDFDFFSMVGDKIVKHVTKKFTVDRLLYLRQQKVFSIDVTNMSSMHLRLPSNTFFTGDLEIKNLAPSKVNISFIPTDSWLRMEVPAIELEENQKTVVRFSIETPANFNEDEKLNSKILVIPNMGNVFEVSIKVVPLSE